MNRGNVRVYIGLGSNEGAREERLQEAVNQLRAIDGIEVARISPVYETEPWGVTEQAPFLNAVVECSVTLSAEALHSAVKAIEEEMGRTETFRYGPRSIDLDILLYGTEQVVSETLTIPHPRMHVRRFVLIPFADIAPDVRHPSLQSTISDMLAGCPDMGRVWKHERELA